MASIQASRFALLKVEDEDEDVDQKNTSANKQNQQKAQKKKNKKKKQQSENQELKHLAFGVPNKQKGHSSSSHGLSNGTNKSAVPDSQWKEWQKMDEGYAAESFEKDLQQALLLSRLENEQEKEKKKSQPSSDSQRGGGEEKEGRKKKKDKPVTMSLEEFNNQDSARKASGDGPSLEGSNKISVQESDKKFFEDVSSDVDRILRQEKMQEEYKKQYAVESVVTAKYQEEMRKKEKEIEFLRATMKKQDEELQQVKKRNKQLCVILAQGEMKDKAEVLMQVEQLNSVKDELTEQVSELTAELEKERSKVHALTKELEKFKSASAKHK